MKLNFSAFALAFGIWWGGGIFLLTWWLIITGNTTGEVGALMQIYPGFSVTAVGSFIGLVWGFVCGVICGGILAWLYNCLTDMVGTRAAKS